MKSFDLYIFLNKNGKILYVGETTLGVTVRIRGHKHLTEDEYAQVSEIWYTSLPSKTALKMYQTYYINKFNPPFNDAEKYGESDLGIELKELEFKKVDFSFCKKEHDFSICNNLKLHKYENEYNFFQPTDKKYSTKSLKIKNIDGENFEISGSGTMSLTKNQIKTMLRYIETNIIFKNIKTDMRRKFSCINKDME